MNKTCICQFLLTSVTIDVKALENVTFLQDPLSGHNSPVVFLPACLSKSLSWQTQPGFAPSKMKYNTQDAVDASRNSQQMKIIIWNRFLLPTFRRRSSKFVSLFSLFPSMFVLFRRVYYSASKLILDSSIHSTFKTLSSMSCNRRSCQKITLNVKNDTKCHKISLISTGEKCTKVTGFFFMWKDHVKMHFQWFWCP